MKPIDYDLCIYQGSSWQLEATFKDPNDAVLDLSQHGGVLAIRRWLEDTTEVIRLDHTAGGVVLAATAPNIVIRMTDTQTTDLPTELQKITDWVYEFRIFEIANPDYTTVRLLEGTVTVVPAVARV